MAALGRLRRALVGAACVASVALQAAPVQADDVSPESAAPVEVPAVEAPTPEAAEPVPEPDLEPIPSAVPEPAPEAEPDVLRAAAATDEADDDPPVPPVVPPRPELSSANASTQVGFYSSYAFVAPDDVPDDVDLLLIDPSRPDALPARCYPSGGAFSCPLDPDVYDEVARTGPLSRTYDIQYRSGGLLSGPTTSIRLDFLASALRPTTEPQLPAGDVLTIEGTYDYGAPGLEVRWELSFGDEQVVTDGSCATAGGESSSFTCTYDSTARAEVTASALPTGSGGGFIREGFEGDTPGTFDVINEVPFSFTVEDGVVVPTTPTTPADGGGDRGSTSTPGPAGSPFVTTPGGASTPGDETVPPTPTDEPDEVLADPPASAISPASAPTPVDALPFLLLLVLLFTVATMVGAPGLAVAGRFAPGSTRTGGGATPTGRWPTADAERSAGLVALAATGATVDGGSGLDAEQRVDRAWGDRSVTWRAPFGRVVDGWGRRAPVRFARRLPMLGRLVADGAHLRAAIGSLWAVVVAAGAVLGLVAAGSSGGRPLAPALALVIVLLAVSVLDAAAGAAAVVTFSLAVVLSGGLTDGLTLGHGVRGLIGLAALWFVAPLIAGAARPLRRLAVAGQSYPWDRAGDAVIAALLSGWAVQGIAGSLGDLVGRDQSVVDRADTLALLTIGLVLLRFALEEVVVRGYPERLRAVVDDADLPEPTTATKIRSVLVRSTVLAFFAWAFLGSCWQLWVGVAIFALPPLVALAHAAIPDVKPISLSLPRGVVETLVMVLVGAGLAYWLDGLGDEGRIDAVRTGFVVLAVPGAALQLLGIVGGEPPEQEWTWPRQLAGAVVVALTVVLVVAFV